MSSDGNAHLDRYIQIMPAEGWYAIYRGENGSEFKCKVTCFALTLRGDIECLDIPPDGSLNNVYDDEQVVRLEYTQFPGRAALRPGQ